MESPTHRLLIRADGDAQMGTGHLMRCVALAQAWHDAGGQATFLTTCTIPELNARLSAVPAGVELLECTPGSVQDAEATLATAARLGANRVVLDGYHFSGDFQRRLKQSDIRLLAIDDYGHATHYAADLVLNQNLHGTPALYKSRESYTKLLLGPRYALLRREFHSWHSWRRDIPRVASKVLVTFGGSDPRGVTLKAIEALGVMEPPIPEVIVVVGGANPWRARLEAAAREAGRNIQLQVDVSDMPRLLAWADVALAAGGTSTWERALFGLPSLVVVLAENQRDLAVASEQTGIGRNLGDDESLKAPALATELRRLLDDAEARAQMAARGPEIIDGLGASRVVARLRAGSLRLRSATSADCRLIWELANEPATRAASFAQDSIPWEQHQSWFNNKLNDPRSAFFVAVDAESRPVGQVRFDVNGAEAVISVSLSQDFHGFGYGPDVIRLGAREVFQAHPVEQIDAFIRMDNMRSHTAFVKAGFAEQQPTIVRGQQAHHLVLHRSAMAGVERP